MGKDGRVGRPWTMARTNCRPLVVTNTSEAKPKEVGPTNKEEEVKKKRSKKQEVKRIRPRLLQKSLPLEQAWMVKYALIRSVIYVQHKPSGN
jgi:hypothetical protein